jgi:N-acetylglucosaminyldiphosphoundecaprenol N-acetyl-beta-D-mannosaminyltransferase
MDILGVKIDNKGLEEFLGTVDLFLSDGRQHHITTPNPEMIVLAQKDLYFKQILNEADLAIADGIGIIFAAKILRQKINKRLSGTDLAESILKKSIGKVFLFGAKNGVAGKIGKRYSNIVGFSENENDAIEMINLSKPNILFVALGAPRQEKWIYENLKKTPSVSVAVGVGGAFDFISGKVLRAPKFLRAIGLEWLWRLIVQPWRIKRMYSAVLKFPFLVLKSKI